MDDKRIREIVESAISQVQAEEKPLQSGSSERSFAHRLAVYMEDDFEKWNVDCEYNRQGMLPKELEGIAGCEIQKKTDRIYPDIIVHHRTNDGEATVGENLLVIELKNDEVEDVCDRRKLELLTHPGGYYKYQLGLHINVGDHKFHKTWYKNGKQVYEEVLFA
mgnify:CR=1 FL=1